MVLKAKLYEDDSGYTQEQNGAKEKSLKKKLSVWYKVKSEERRWNTMNSLTIQMGVSGKMKPGWAF